MCGEDSSVQAWTQKALETPPRVWGRLPKPPCAADRPGNTPTCVGKTLSFQQLESRYWKHPHVCGEDLISWCWCLRERETPPRVWGRPRHIGGYWQSLGNTPTCVGKTSCHLSQTLNHRKHPHVCGEDSTVLTSLTKLAETPPRVWGRRSCLSSTLRYFGNTPTCVGKTYRN